MQLAPSTWYTRTVGWFTGGFRAALSRLPALRSRPAAAAGISGGVIASKGMSAESDLAAMATSPVVYSAMIYRCLGMSLYPTRVYEGWGMTAELDLVDPKRAPWVSSFLRVLQRPDPADAEALAPAHTGEALFAQILADLILTGVFFVAPTLSAGGEVIGLARLHPRLCRLVRKAGEEWLVYEYGSLAERWYPRRSVFTGTLPSWSSTAQSEFGVGAGTPLAPLIDAERTALLQTASTIRQGGADIVITGKDAQTQAMLGNKAAREQVVTEAIHQLGGAGEGRRVFALGGNLSVSPSGLAPADIKAPELLKASERLELMAVGAVPVAVGAEAGAYAEAIAQYRVQAERDEQIVSVLEAAFLRPLAQHFARRAGGRWAARADTITARLDLSSHPGYASVRTDALNRVKLMKDMGWTAKQASEAEGLDLPEPEGAPAPEPAVANSPPLQAESAPQVNRPQGEAKKPRMLIDLFRATDPAPVDEWASIEAARAPWDERLTAATSKVLEREREGYVSRALVELEKAAARREDKPAYGVIDMEKVLGDFNASLRVWMDGLAPDWGACWDDGAAAALDHLEASGIPEVTLRPADYAPLELSARGGIDWTRMQVRGTILGGMDQGLSPTDIAKELRDSFAFDPVRALRFARTETNRAQTSGQLARAQKAAEVGAAVAQEWVSDPAAAQWDRRHDMMHGKRVAVGGTWTLPSGIATRGPALSGDPGEDCNCRCASRLRKVQAVGLTVSAA